MADTFGRQFSSLAGKLKIDPKKDSELKKALDPGSGSFYRLGASPSPAQAAPVSNGAA